MAKRSKPIPEDVHRFVVVVDASAQAQDLQDRAGESVSWETVNGHPEMFLASVIPPNRKTSREESWEWLTGCLGPSASVLPIEEEVSGRFPTGQIGVRFDRSHTVAELKKLAKRFDLEFLSKNEFVPEQATFRIARQKSVWLPEVLKALEAPELGVRKAWPESVQKFTRGETPESTGP